jgi:hypothetical protein
MILNKRLFRIKYFLKEIEVGSLKSIDTEEAARVKKMIMEQSEIAKSAIRKVKNCPQELTSFKGDRANRFQTDTNAQMQKLESAITVVDEAATALQNAISAFVNADS